MLHKTQSRCEKAGAPRRRGRKPKVPEDLEQQVSPKKLDAGPFQAATSIAVVQTASQRGACVLSAEMYLEAHSPGRS